MGDKGSAASVPESRSLGIFRPSVHDTHTQLIPPVTPQFQLPGASFYPLAVSTHKQAHRGRQKSSVHKEALRIIFSGATCYGNTLLRATTQGATASGTGPTLNNTPSYPNVKYCKSAMRDNAYIEKGTIMHPARE